MLPFVSQMDFDRHAGTTGLMGRLMRSISFIQGGLGRSRVGVDGCEPVALQEESH